MIKDKDPYPEYRPKKTKTIPTYYGKIVSIPKDKLNHPKILFKKDL